MSEGGGGINIAGLLVVAGGLFLVVVALRNTQDKVFPFFFGKSASTPADTSKPASQPDSKGKCPTGSINIGGICVGICPPDKPINIGGTCYAIPGLTSTSPGTGNNCGPGYTWVPGLNVCIKG